MVELLRRHDYPGLFEPLEMENIPHIHVSRGKKLKLHLSLQCFIHRHPHTPH